MIHITTGTITTVYKGMTWVIVKGEELSNITYYGDKMFAYYRDERITIDLNENIGNIRLLRKD